MAAVSILTALLGACASTHPLMPAPSLYRGPEAIPLFTKVPPAQQIPAIDLLYATDRAPQSDSEGSGPYGADRSRSMAFGTVRVDIGDGTTWDSLVRQSTSDERPDPLNLTLGPTHELGHFPPVSYQIVPTPHGFTRDAGFMDMHEKAVAEFKAELGRRVAESPRKEVVLFVHGYNETFADAAFKMSELCHFFGREYVCAIFSWPAGGSRGILFGYNTDRESGEFAVEHLKKTIRMIADTPGVERIDLLAHSRGTDVLTAALSLLNIETYITRTSLRERLKIVNVVLIAPDMDFDIAVARIFSVASDPDLPYGNAPNPRGEIRTPAPPHLTVYVSPDDKALTVAEYLFGSMVRLGRLEAANVSEESIEAARKAGFVDVISVSGTTDLFGHSYFTSNPDVSSDLIALIRYGAKPGDALRPLVEVARPFWRIRTPEDASRQ
jgi:esterase/lipase superfamily enzyme